MEGDYIMYFEHQLENGRFRYEGNFHTVKYCIDSKIKKSKEQIENYLNNCSIDFLVNNEGYIISI